MYVFLGTTIGSIQDAASGNYDAGPAGLALVIFGCVFACVAIIYVSIVVRRYLRAAVEFECVQNEPLSDKSEIGDYYIVEQSHDD